MAHVRTTIRNDLLTALTGLTITGANVFANRVQVIPEANMPALIIQTLSESANYAESFLGCDLRRDVEVTLQVRHKESGVTLADVFDTIAKEIEVELITGAAGLNAYVQGIDYVGTEFEYEEDNDKLMGTMTITYLIYYYAAEGYPETAIT